MKTQGFRGVCKLGVAATLLVGMAYSVLVVVSKPVYASTCDCDSDDEAYATAYCSFRNQGFVTSFVCPFQGSNYFEFTCEKGGPYISVCQ